MGWHGGMHADCDATKRHRGATKERVPSSRQLANRPLRRRRTRRTEPDVRALLGKLGELQQRRESSCAELKLLHFDTRQYLHFGWSTHAELRERLELHIRATIPGRATAKRRGKG